MAWVDLFDRLIEERLPDLRVERDADMKKYTSFHIGGSARRIGGGGLGKIAINYGYHRYNLAVCLVATVLIVILVQIAQAIGSYLSARVDHQGKTRKVRYRVRLNDPARREETT